mmetsp:Transcript_24102/g.23164  ORF Transcript_24102/g.23164 Transcript_24102/m.23164 type:complete len:81 (-) Transcript_24102:935-1177(-)
MGIGIGIDIRGISMSVPLKDLEAFIFLGATRDEVDEEGAPVISIGLASSAPDLRVNAGRLALGCGDTGLLTDWDAGEGYS